jgi:hypothetical protein
VACSAICRFWLRRRAGGPPLTVTVCTIPTEGAPSLRFLQGWERCCPRYLICCGGVIKPTWRGISDSRPSQSARRTGTRSVVMPARSEAWATPPCLWMTIEGQRRRAGVSVPHGRTVSEESSNNRFAGR